MESNILLTYLACICFIFLFGKILVKPMKFVLKLVLNSVIGGLIIFLINLVGASFYFHIGLNIVTSVVVGILGIPGAVLLVVLKLIV